MKKCLNQEKKSICFIYNLTKTRSKVIFDFDMGNIGCIESVNMRLMMKACSLCAVYLVFFFLMCTVEGYAMPGELLWKYEAGGSICGSVALNSDGSIYFCANDDSLYALNKDGTRQWAVQVTNDGYASPTVGKDGTVYIGSQDGYLYAFQPDGSVKWQFEADGALQGAPSIGPDGSIYVIAHSLYAIGSDGFQKWRVRDIEGWNSSPAIGNDGTIYIASANNKTFYAFDSNGALKWNYNIGYYTFCSPSIDADGNIYIGAEEISESGYNRAIYFHSTRRAL